MKPYDHAVASAKVFGGKYQDYIEIHKWFDQFRFAVKDPNHRMFLHHTGGVIICEQVFGDYITNSDGKKVAVRDIAEHHITTDVGEMRTPQEWLENIGAPDWTKPIKSKIEKLVEKAENTYIHCSLDEIDALFDLVENDNLKSDRKKESNDITTEFFKVDDGDMLKTHSPLENSLNEKIEQLESKVRNLATVYQTFD